MVEPVGNGEMQFLVKQRHEDRILAQLGHGNDLHDRVHDALGDSGEDAPLEVEENAVADLGGQPMHQLSLSFVPDQLASTAADVGADAGADAGANVGV